MGKIIQARLLPKSGYASLLKPIIYCSPTVDISSDAVSLNILLAKELALLRPKRRTMQLEGIFNRVLDGLPYNVVIKDFDVLFNPEYKVDVLRILVNSCKRKPFSVIWPGRYEEKKLFYAEEGYPDYKVYSVDDYDVTCVV